MKERLSVKEIIVGEAAAELHAATLAVLLHFGHPEIEEAAEAYCTRVLTRYHAAPDVRDAVERHLADVKRRAARQAGDLEEGIYAHRLGRLGRGDAPPSDERERERGEVLAF